MFKDGDNFVGVLLVALCAVIGGVMVWAIATDAKLEYNGPMWLAWLLAGLFIVGTLYLGYQGFVKKSGREWPNPGAGQRSLWDRIRGKGDETPRA